MSERNAEIKRYIETLFNNEAEKLKEIKAQAKEESLPEIHVPSNVGKLLNFLTKIAKPKRILEIGTLAGFSTIWLAKALQIGGKVISIEGVEKHVKIARENLSKFGVNDLVEVLHGNAEMLLKKMVSDQIEPFDLIFIDADKENYPLYLDLVLPLTHVGTLILSDNLIPKHGEVGKPLEEDEEANAIYTFNQKLSKHSKLESILIPTIVGEKGRVDALGLSIVLA